MSEIRWVLFNKDGSKEVCGCPTATDALEYANNILYIKEEFDCSSTDDRLSDMENVLRLLKTLNKGVEQMGNKMIDINKKYKTRDGKEVRIYATDHVGSYPICGAIRYLDGWDNEAWKEDGRNSNYVEDDPDDLVEVSKYEDFKIDDKVIVWENDYPDRKERGYFAGVNEDGYPMVFMNGRTSFIEVDTCWWDNCEKYDHMKHGE